MVQSYIGAPIQRREDVRFLTGRATFVDDLKLPDMLHAAILRSSHAHARIKGIETSQASAIPGVVAVFTYEDFADLAKPIPIRLYPLPGLEPFLQYPLSRGVVRHVGEALAVVVAESRALAEDALDAIEVDYEPLPVVTDLRDALRNEVVLHEHAGTNLAGEFTVRTGDVEEAFRNAEYTRKEVFKTHRHTGNPLETRGMVAAYNAGTEEFTVWGPTKVPHFNRNVLASMLEISPEKIHFIEPDVGGGFGIRGEFYPEDFLIPVACRKVGRPVKWIEDRMEHLAAANHSREVLCEIEIAAKRDGTILGMRANIYGDMGAYIRTHGSLVPASTAVLLTGQYRVPAYECNVKCVLTNKMGVGTFRAPGRYESCFIRERLMDMMASDLGIDPAELRFKNYIQPEEMPYDIGPTRVEGNTVFDSGDYPSALRRAMAEIDYDGLKFRQGKHDDGKYHGVGIGSFVKNTGRGPDESARVVLRAADDIAVYLGITTMGQGHETTMAQICADSLGIPMDNIRVYHGNTDFMPTGGGTFGSRGTVMAGSAIHLACQELRSKILAVAGGNLDIDPADLDFREGRVYRKDREGEGPLLNLDNVLEMAAAADPASLQEPGMESTGRFESQGLTYAYGCHIAHVAVDPDTGQVEVLRYVVVEDIGRCINPMVVHGQAVGGAVQGIGATLLEELVYADNGQLLSGSFMDYLLPTSTEAPAIESIILEEAPSPLNPLGVKGAGEGGIVATGAALANAVSDALAIKGVQVRQLPLTPNRIKELLDGSGS